MRLISIALGFGLASTAVAKARRQASLTTTTAVATTTTQAKRTTTVPSPSSTTDVDLSITSVEAFACPPTSSPNVPSNVDFASLAPGLLLASLDSASDLAVKIGASSPLLLNVIDQRLSLRNATGGDWGVTANGTLFHTPADCSATYLFSVAAPQKARHKKRGPVAKPKKPVKRADNLDDTVNIDLTLHLRDGSRVPSDCSLSLLAICTDMEDSSYNEDVQLAYVGPNEYGGACPFKKADELNNCLVEVKALTDFAAAGKDAQSSVNNIFDLGKVEGVCTRVATFPVPNAASAVALAACLASLDALQKLLSDDVQNAVPAQVCKAMGLDNENSLFEIDVYNIAAGGSPLLFSDTITGMKPADIKTALNIFSDQAGCSTQSTTTTSSTSTTASSTSTAPHSGVTCPASATCDAGVIPPGCYQLCFFRYNETSDLLGSGTLYQTPPTCRIPAGQRDAACESAYESCEFAAGTNGAALAACFTQSQVCFDSQKYVECDCTLDVCRAQLG